MTRVYRSLMILLVIVLIILGLNTSNQATNSLTKDNEKPLIGFNIERENVNIFALGEQYSYSRQELSQESSGVLHNAKQILKSITDYLKKIWTIFRVIFLT